MSLRTALRAMRLSRETESKRITAEQRTRWAGAIRAVMRAHPRQWASATSNAPMRATCGNRRAGKTEGHGREVTARLIERSGYTVWVFADDLSEFDRNWISRGLTADDGGHFADGAVASARQKTGMLKLLREMGVPHHARKSSHGPITQITFPWGSSLQVLSLKDEHRLAAARGGSFDLLWLDEAQKLALIVAVLEEMFGPAGADFDAPVWLTGTPGEELGSFFHRVVTGAISGWEVHDLSSADNPHFGTTWAERFERACLGRIRLLAATQGTTQEQLELLAGLTNETFALPVLTALPWVEHLPPKVQREYLRLWVADATTMVYPRDGLGDHVLYWGDWASGVTSAALGINVTAERMMEQVDGWRARLALLPRVPLPHGKSEPKRWRAILGIDLGHNPDPFALWLGLEASNDANLYEFDSAKATLLRDDQQLAVIEHWIMAIRAMDCVTLHLVVIDDKGGNTPAQVRGWQRKLAPLLPRTGLIGAYKPHKRMQIRALNVKRQQGRIKALRYSPADIEEQYLRWTSFDPTRPDRKRDVDKHRAHHIPVEGGDVIECMPGDHCLDARRYVEYQSTSIHGHDPDVPDTPPTPEAWFGQQVEKWHKRKPKRR